MSVYVQTHWHYTSFYGIWQTIRESEAFVLNSDMKEHCVILGEARSVWQDVDYVLRCFAEKRTTAKKRYLDYVRQGIEMGNRPDLTGGGLIRSLGGWSEAKSLRKEDIRLKGDERILGDSDYVLEVLKETGERFERGYELKAQGYDLDMLARRVAEIFRVRPEEIFRPGKYKKRVEARSVLSYWAVRELGETASAIAKKIGISQPAVSLSVERGERIVKKMELTL
jgi:putative transposase